MKYTLFILLVVIECSSFGQSILDNSGLKIVNLPTSSRENYLGKASLGTFEPDIALATACPSLIQYNTKNQFLATTAFYFGTNYVNASYSSNVETFDFPYVVGLSALVYGKQRHIDVDGNELGTFYPTEAMLYFAGSKTYENYNFGWNTKLVYGNYLLASTLGLAADFSMMYRDVERELYVTVIMKNVGFRIFNSHMSNAPFPFDIRLGLSKKLKHLPFRFSIVAQELYRWTAVTTSPDYYYQPLSPYVSTDNISFFGSLMSHFVFSGEFNIGDAFRFGMSYDVKKAVESKFDQFRGMNGIGLGFGIYGRKYSVGYSFSKISPISDSHEISLSFNFDEWMKRR